MVSSEAFDAVIVLGLIGSAPFGIRPVQAAHRMGFIPDEELRMFEEGAKVVDYFILEAIMTLMDTYHKPIYPVSLAAFPEDKIVHAREGSPYKVIVYKTPEMAVLCLSKQYLYSKYIQMRGNG